jgi:hypothetical protein
MTFDSQESTSIWPDHDLVIQGTVHWPHASCLGAGCLSLTGCLKAGRTLTILSQSHFDADTY